MMRNVYADYAATAPLRLEARAAMEQWLCRLQGNPNSLHYAGVQSREALEDARRRIAACVGCNPAR